MTDHIIDVSHWEDGITFAKVKAAGFVAVIAKATQGAAVTDNCYAKFKRDALANGLLWGSYHFGTGSEVELQVAHYLDVARPSDQELICLDFEPNNQGPTMTLNQAREFVAQIEDKTGRWPVLYGGHWLKECLNGKKDDLLSRCPLWLAQYGPKAVLPPGWKQWALWQYTETDAGVPGVAKCDRDRYAGTDAQLRKQWPFV